MDFAGTTVLVTGAVGSIGKGIAASFCASGARVFVTGLEQQSVDSFAEGNLIWM